jgi:hypothetical protein
MSRTRTRNPLRLAPGIATRSRVRLALGLAAGLLAALPAAAPAATLGVAIDNGVTSVRYLAAPGEMNRLEVSEASGEIAFVDPGATIDAAGPSCTEVSAHEARCLSSAAPALGISLGDRDDSATIDVAKPGLLDGDAGNDTLTGGAGDDGLWGGDGNDVLEGRDGADLMSGEGGTDSVRYDDRGADVSVDLTKLTIRSEGEAGEHDTVATDVERVTGGAGDDVLTGNNAANLLDGGAGDDVLTGGGGADDLRGASGRDLLRGRDSVADRLDCGADRDAVDADPADAVSECEGGAPGGIVPTPINRNPVVTPPAPLTAPFSFIFGSVKLPEGPVTLHGGHITLTVGCPAGTPTGRCSGVISLERFARRGGKAKAKSSRRTKRFRVADQAYAVRAGKKSRVRVRISSVGRRAINRTGSLRVKVYLRRTKRAHRATRIGTLKVRASRRTKRRLPRNAS